MFEDAVGNRYSISVEIWNILVYGILIGFMYNSMV